MQNVQGAYSARTENNILIVFTVEGNEKLSLDEELEVDLPSLLKSQQVTRLKDQRIVSIKLKPDDIHDLDLPPNHGSSGTPSMERLKR